MQTYRIEEKPLTKAASAPGSNKSGAARKTFCTQSVSAAPAKQRRERKQLLLMR